MLKNPELAHVITSEAFVTIPIPRSTIEQLLHHAASAAQLVGHLDDEAQPDLIRQLGDRVDTIAHELAELLGTPSALAEPDDRKARDGAPMFTAITGGAP